MPDDVDGIFQALGQLFRTGQDVRKLSRLGLRFTVTLDPDLSGVDPLCREDEIHANLQNKSGGPCGGNEVCGATRFINHKSRRTDG